MVRRVQHAAGQKIAHLIYLFSLASRVSGHFRVTLPAPSKAACTYQIKRRPARQRSEHATQRRSSNAPTDTAAPGRQGRSIAVAVVASLRRADDDEPELATHGRCSGWAGSRPVLSLHARVFSHCRRARSNSTNDTRSLIVSTGAFSATH